jgi:hypothetical protein
MGDEGRLPPSLNGVGAKMRPDYLKQIFAEGSDDRPYMHTRMPRYGLDNIGALLPVLAQVDTLPAVKEVTFQESTKAVKQAGRHIVGAKALGCIKCHTFNGEKAEGVQGIDMTLMPKRLNRDWFFPYLLNPSKFRPGTRMPTAWPDGMTALPNVLGGSTDKQIEAIWSYLSDGKKALTPVGMGAHFIELIPENEAIIYRNFIAGAGPRAIGVGFPEHVNLAFDAENQRLALLWQGAFIDAGRHWNDRGVGYQGPLGDAILQMPDGPAFVQLSKDDQPWPNQPSKQLGYEFRGYRLTPDQRPTFRYSYKDIQIEDFPNAVKGKSQLGLHRTLSLTATQPVDDLFFRAAVGNKIEASGDGWYRINDQYRIRIESAAQPQIRNSGGHQELLVPVRFTNNRAEIVQDIVW